MIVDSSALVAILTGEDGWQAFRDTILSATGECALSAAGYLETAIVTDARGRDGKLADTLDDFIESANITIAPVTEVQARIAREAYRTFGKGSGHAAQLNFGDCFAYALAKEKDEVLLFKGNDFSQTDLTPALA